MKTKILAGLAVVLIPAFLLITHKSKSDLRDAPGNSSAWDSLKSVAGDDGTNSPASPVAEVPAPKPTRDTNRGKTAPSGNVHTIKIPTPADSFAVCRVVGEYLEKSGAKVEDCDGQGVINPIVTITYVSEKPVEVPIQTAIKPVVSKHDENLARLQALKMADYLEEKKIPVLLADSRGKAGGLLGYDAMVSYISKEPVEIPLPTDPEYKAVALQGIAHSGPLDYACKNISEYLKKAGASKTTCLSREKIVSLTQSNYVLTVEYVSEKPIEAHVQVAIKRVLNSADDDLTEIGSKLIAGYLRNRGKSVMFTDWRERAQGLLGSYAIVGYISAKPVEIPQPDCANNDCVLRGVAQ